MSKCEDIIDAIFDKDKKIADVIKKKKNDNIEFEDEAEKAKIDAEKDDPSFLGNLGNMAKDYVEDKVEDAVEYAKEYIEEKVDEVLDQVNNVIDTAKKLKEKAEKYTKKSTYKKLGKKAKEKLRSAAKTAVCNNRVVTSVSNAVDSVNQAVDKVKNYSGKKKNELKIKNDPQKAAAVNEKLQDDIKKDVAKNLQAEKKEEKKEEITQPVVLDDIAIAISQSTLNQDNPSSTTGVMFDMGDVTGIFESIYTGSMTTCLGELETFLHNYQLFNSVKQEIESKFPSTLTLHGSGGFLEKWKDMEDRITAGKILWELNSKAILYLNSMNHSLYDLFMNCNKSEYLYSNEYIKANIIDYFPDPEMNSNSDILGSGQYAPTVALATTSSYIDETDHDTKDLRGFIKLYIEQYGKSVLRTDLYPCLRNTFALFDTDGHICYGEYWSKYYVWSTSKMEWVANEVVETHEGDLPPGETLGWNELNIVSIDKSPSRPWPDVSMNFDTGDLEATQLQYNDLFETIYKFYNQEI
jgi:hypothetical protein